MRARAVAFALFYGTVPTWLYEVQPHHELGYWAHFRLNLSMATRWATWNETPSDREFEGDANHVSPIGRMAGRWTLC